MPDDASLLRRYVETRAEDAFADIVRRHVDAVYSSALRRVGGDTHLAEDVTQQVFVALARRAAAVARHPALISWLHVATRHEAANAVRAERRRKTREHTALAMQLSTAEPATEADWSRIAPLIDTEIDCLGERDRAALLLRFVDHRTFPEIGAALQLTADAARRRVDRALEKLRHSLARRGVASTSAALSLAMASHAVAAAPAGLAAGATSTALATATTSAFAAGLLQFMTAAKITTSAVGLALLLATFGVTTFEVQRARDATAALLTAQATDSALADRLHALNGQIAAAEHDTADLAKKVSDAETAAAESARRAAAAAAKAAAWNPAAEGQAFMERHPAVRQALIAFFNAQTNYQWSAFYKTAGLTPAQIAEFQTLMREQGGFSRSKIQGSGDLAFHLGATRSGEEFTTRMHALLGEDGYQKYSSYSAALPARELGAQVATALAFTPTPLTAAQFDQLTSTINEKHATAYTQTGPSYDWTVITKSAQEILSSPQQTVLDGLRAQAEFDQAYSEAFMTMKKSATSHTR